MSLRHCVRLVALGTLLAGSGHLLAQGTTLTNLNGSRHCGKDCIVASTSSFGVGVTKDGGATYVSSATVADNVQIRTEVRPEAENVGQTGDIFLVDRVVTDTGGHISFSMRDQSGVWLPWNGTVSLLVPFIDNTTLQQTMPLDLFTGTLGTEGNHRIFVGYMSATDGILRYHTSGLPLTVTAAAPTQTPQQQAFALFETKINPNIVQASCIACHVSGGLAGHLHTFEFGTTGAAVTANYNVFIGLKGRGKAFLMDYLTQPITDHDGGQAVFPASNVTDFDAFLTLLSQF